MAKNIMVLLAILGVITFGSFLLLSQQLSLEAEDRSHLLQNLPSRDALLQRTKALLPQAALAFFDSIDEEDTLVRPPNSAYTLLDLSSHPSHCPLGQSLDPSNTLARDCGFPDISREECAARQCCWHEPLSDPRSPVTPSSKCLMSPISRYTCTADGPSREDCGYPDITEAGCLQRACCWDGTMVRGNNTTTSSTSSQPPPFPSCFRKRRICGEYAVSKKAYLPSGRGFTLTLRALEPACVVYGPEAPTLHVHVTYVGRDRLRVRITDDAPGTPPSSIIQDILPETEVPSTPFSPRFLDYAFTYTSSPFTFAIARINSRAPIFNSSLPGSAGLRFSPHYREISTYLPAGTSLFGLGEHLTSLRVNTTHGHRQILWARGSQEESEAGIYGSHPMHMELREGMAHAVTFLNTHATEVDAVGSTITYKATGGDLDFLFCIGPTPREVSKQFTQSVGRPALPPYWALGWHQSYAGDSSTTAIRAIIDMYRQENLPLEAIWTDVAFMNGIRTPYSRSGPGASLPEMRALVHDLRQARQRWIASIHTAASVKADDRLWQEGIDLGVFTLSSTPHGGILTGSTPTGPIALPDWLSPRISEWWGRHLMHATLDLPVDGWLLDRNVPSLLCGDECSARALQADKMSRNAHADRLAKEASTSEENAPVLDEALGENEPRARGDRERRNDPSGKDEASRLEGKLRTEGDDISNAPPSAIATFRDAFYPFSVGYNVHGERFPFPSAFFDTQTSYHGGHSGLEVHNIFGHLSAKTTMEVAIQSDEGRRPLVITRSAFLGTGKYAAHIIGGSKATWGALARSIPRILSFQLYGTPLVGTDICGHQGDASVELCERWHQLGAFYPLARTHHVHKDGDTFANQAHPQQSTADHATWGKVFPSARASITLRYHLLPYLYTLLHEASVSGAPIWRPLWYEFPHDGYGSLEVEGQFLVGPSLLITPVLGPGLSSVTAYFPPGVWYGMEDGLRVQSRGEVRVLPVSPDRIPVHIRGGSIIMTQGRRSPPTPEEMEQTDPAPPPIPLTTYDARKGDYHLIVVLDARGMAQGSLYLDDGESMHVEHARSEIKFVVLDSRILTISGRWEGMVARGRITSITIRGGGEEGSWGEYGSPHYVKKVVLNGLPLTDARLTVVPGTVRLTKLHLSLNGPSTLSWGG